MQFKVGDRVRVKRPENASSLECVWVPGMDRYDGTVQTVKTIEPFLTLDDCCACPGSARYVFEADWLTPVPEIVCRATDLAAALQRAEAAEKERDAAVSECSVQRDEKCRAYNEAAEWEETAKAAEKRAAEAETKHAAIKSEWAAYRNGCMHTCGACGTSFNDWDEMEHHIQHVCLKHPLRRVEALEKENADLRYRADTAETALSEKGLCTRESGLLACSYCGRLLNHQKHADDCPMEDRRRVEALTAENAALKGGAIGDLLRVARESRNAIFTECEGLKAENERLKDEAATLRKHRSVIQSALDRAGFDVTVVSYDGVLKGVVTKYETDFRPGPTSIGYTVPKGHACAECALPALSCADCSTTAGVSYTNNTSALRGDPLCVECMKARAFPAPRWRRVARWAWAQKWKALALGGTVAAYEGVYRAALAGWL